MCPYAFGCHKQGGGCLFMGWGLFSWKWLVNIVMSENIRRELLLLATGILGGLSSMGTDWSNDQRKIHDSAQSTALKADGIKVRYLSDDMLQTDWYSPSGMSHEKYGLNTSRLVPVCWWKEGLRNTVSELLSVVKQRKVCNKSNGMWNSFCLSGCFNL